MYVLPMQYDAEVSRVIDFVLSPRFKSSFGRVLWIPMLHRAAKLKYKISVLPLIALPQQIVQVIENNMGHSILCNLLRHRIKFPQFLPVLIAV